MTVYVIGDENAVLGLALVGVEGEAVRSVEGARRALEAALQRPGVGIVLLTEEWAAQMREEVDELKMDLYEPLLLEIPSSTPTRRATPLRTLVQQALGIRL